MTPLFFNSELFANPYHDKDAGFIAKAERLHLLPYENRREFVGWKSLMPK